MEWPVMWLILTPAGIMVAAMAVASTSTEID